MAHAATDRQLMQQTYGDRFKDGFAGFQQSGLFADVTVHTASGEWQLHSILLATRSEFFYRALSGEFTESKSKVIELHLENSEEVRRTACCCPLLPSLFDGKLWKFLDHKQWTFLTALAGHIFYLSCRLGA
jgi:hypothetical protein